MNRRQFLQTGISMAGAAALQQKAYAELKKMKITRVRYYHAPFSRPIFNQSFHTVVVETDAGITGIGEGGSKDTVEQVAAMVIGESPNRIEHLWQLMYRGYFYPPGREKIHAVGALDMALWDIKGKALGIPLYELLGGLTRDYVECYSTGFPSKGSTRETARACMEAGFRAYRTGVLDAAAKDAPNFDRRHVIQATYEHCKEIREGVGPKGDWCIDFHTRLDLNDAIRLSDMIAPLDPYFVEDRVRSENKDVYRDVRSMVKVPIAVGEHYGDRWEVNELIENRWIDYSRVTIPNCGGIGEFQKIAAIAETHYVGLTPHFTGPIATATLVHCCGCSSGPALMELRGNGPSAQETPHLPELMNFRNGKLYPVSRPGLGVTFDPAQSTHVLDVTENSRPIPMLKRPDGSWTNW